MKDDLGVVWSKKFHSGSKKKNNDGSWKLKRRCDKAACKAYEASFISPEEELVVEVPFVEEVTPATEVKKEEAQVVEGYLNTRKGEFEMFGVVWAPGEVKPVPEEIEREKKFKYAVQLGCLVKQ